jgi:hypothetical protein
VADKEVPEFDPRFDPAFQRGFDGPVGRRSAAGAEASTGYLRSTRPATVQAPAALNQPLEPARQQEWENFLDAGKSGGQDQTRTSSEVATASAFVDDEPLETTRGRNPFLIVLLIISVVLIGGGVGGLQWLRAKFLAPDIATDLDFVTLQASTVGAAIVVGLGLATAIGVLFVYAVRWRGRRP